MTEPPRADLLVAGDATVDWMLVTPPGESAGAQLSYRWDQPGNVLLNAQAGGAALLTNVLRTMLAEPHDRHASPVLAGVDLPPGALRDPNYPAVTRVFTRWSPLPRLHGSREVAWRIEEFLGQVSASERLQHANQGSAAEPGCIVLDDSNQGFRDDIDAWPAQLTSGQPKNLVLKLSSPLAEGRLWRHLVDNFAERLTVYVPVGELRKGESSVGQPLSWERTSRDIVKAVRAHHGLARAERVIVSLGLAGAVLVERNGPATLLFDPAHQEGDWEDRRPGIPYMVGICITAALASEAVLTPGEADWKAAVGRGLSAARSVHEGGFELSEDDGTPGLAFPIARIVQVLRAGESSWIRSGTIPDDDEFILASSGFSNGYQDAAERVVRHGIGPATADMPVERIGAWASVERAEIESMRSIRNIVREYFLQQRKTRPLSLAVFGPPGAGKSFAIKQMATEWSRGGTALSVLEFNLSQFSSTADLASAFQRIRDCAVEGNLPLVFWDEFDSARAGAELGWLAPFLAPMQDGAFLDNGAVRPIGPAIMVFAGGTHRTMSSFKQRAGEIPGAKATDFLSRLRGYVDILGPNPASAADRTYLLRRAFLLRPLLERRAPQLFNGGRLSIDPGVLNAFLGVPSYVHGARSMEALVEMSSLSGRLRYERSALPAQHQLSLHVDAEEFLGLVRSVTAATGQS